MRFSLKQIEVFDAIVRLGGLSRAADEVALSQSAASSALKELEENLGTKLFHRHGRKLVLNENGRRLHPNVHSLILLAAEIQKPQTAELEGQLRIATSMTIGNHVLPKCSTAFLSRHPKVQMEIIIGSITEVVERVEAISVDLGLIDTTCNRNTVQVEPIGHDRAVVFGAPNHPLAGRRQVSMTELRSADWCLRAAPSLTRVHLATTLGGGGLHNIRFVANSYEAVKTAVIAGLGLGFASTRIITREVAAGDLVVINAPSVALERKLNLIAPKSVYQGALPKAFADHLRTHFAVEQPAAPLKDEIAHRTRPHLPGRDRMGSGLPKVTCP